MPKLKYKAEDGAFDEKHGVLTNKLDILDKQKLEVAEGQVLFLAYEKAALKYSDQHSFTCK